MILYWEYEKGLSSILRVLIMDKCADVGDHFGCQGWLIQDFSLNISRRSSSTPPAKVIATNWRRRSRRAVKTPKRGPAKYELLEGFGSQSSMAWWLTTRARDLLRDLLLSGPPKRASRSRGESRRMPETAYYYYACARAWTGGRQLPSGRILDKGYEFVLTEDSDEIYHQAWRSGRKEFKSVSDEDASPPARGEGAGHTAEETKRC
jgi:hypothetical protein